MVLVIVENGLFLLKMKPKTQQQDQLHEHVTCATNSTRTAHLELFHACLIHHCNGLEILNQFGRRAPSFSFYIGTHKYIGSLDCRNGEHQGRVDTNGLTEKNCFKCGEEISTRRTK